MNELSHLIDNDYSRENLIAICEAAVVPQNKWINRDSPGAHEKIGLCWVMLKAGCEFNVHTSTDDDDARSCVTNDQTIWLRVHWQTFNSFEYGDSNSTTSELFYIPTPARLKANAGRDWY